MLLMTKRISFARSPLSVSVRLAVFFSCLASVPVHAAEVQPPVMPDAYPKAVTEPAGKPATGVSGNLAAALVHLWDTHPEVRLAKSNVTAAGHDVRGAWTSFYPYARATYESGDETDSRLVSFILPLWRGGANFAGVDVAEASREAAIADVNRTRLRLGLRLSEVWYATASADEQAAYWDTYVDALERLQGIIKRRADAGAAPYSDVVNALTRLRQAEALRQQNLSVRESSRAQVAALLGYGGTQPRWPDAAYGLSDAESASALERAGENNPEIVFAQARLEGQRATARVSRGSMSPEVLLQHDKNFGNDDDADPLTPDQTKVVVQYQTDNGLRGYQSWRASQQRSNAAESGVESARRELQSAIRSAQAERTAARSQMDYQEAAIESADAVVESFIRQFEVGRKTWVEVLNAQREAHETRIALSQQKRVYWQASTRIALQGLYWERMLETLQMADKAGPYQTGKKATKKARTTK